MLNTIHTLTEEQQRALSDFHEIGIDACLTEDGAIKVGEHEVIALAAVNTHIVASTAFADGYCAGYAACEAMGDDGPAALTDGEFTARINQIIPDVLTELAHKQGRQGYIFGWAMSWCEAVG